MSEPLPHFTELSQLEAYMVACQRCPCGDTRSRLVFGVGNPQADIMFIGEAPGKNEDLQGEPFVGAAGKLLDELLASAGLSRADTYIANILKCRPPNNRDPLPDEIEACTPFLEEQIRLIDPRVIVTLGRFATQFMLKTDVGISRLRGRRHEVDGRAVLPIFHPAAALYDQSKREVLEDDFKRLATLLARELGGEQAGGEDALEPMSESSPGAETSPHDLRDPSAGLPSSTDPPGPRQGTLF